MIGDLLPATVRWNEAFDDDCEVALFSAEQAQIARSTPERKKEFATVRACARRAMAELGRPAVPLVRGPGGAPRWPDGLVGSLTHCRGYRAAVVAPAAVVRSVGIDAEPALPLPTGVFGLIGSAAERSAVAGLVADDAAVPWDRLLFCAKEAVYKAWFPLTARWLKFGDVSVDLQPGGTFAARLPNAGHDEPAGFTGRWLAHRGFLVTSVVCPVSDGAAYRR